MQNSYAVDCNHISRRTRTYGKGDAFVIASVEIRKALASPMSTKCVFFLLLSSIRRRIHFTMLTVVEHGSHILYAFNPVDDKWRNCQWKGHGPVPYANDGPTSW